MLPAPCQPGLGCSVPSVRDEGRGRRGHCWAPWAFRCVSGCLGERLGGMFRGPERMGTEPTSLSCLVWGLRVPLEPKVLAGVGCQEEAVRVGVGAVVSPVAPGLPCPPPALPAVGGREGEGRAWRRPPAGPRGADSKHECGRRGRRCRAHPAPRWPLLSTSGCRVSLPPSGQQAAARGVPGQQGRRLPREGWSGDGLGCSGSALGRPLGAVGAGPHS